MAKKKRAGDIEECLGALEVGLKGLGDISKELTKVRANLRKFLDEAEGLSSILPRHIPRSRTKTPGG
jgi:hypothetical protein